MFDRLRSALRAALDAATPPPEGDLRDLARQMREALIDAKTSLAEMRDALRRAGAELDAERQRLADTERRGRLAGEVQDGETVAVAERFAAKHRERIAVLERKVAAQRDELTFTEREVQEMRDQLMRAERDRPLTEAERSAERAWRELQRAGGERSETAHTAQEIDRAAREHQAEQQLREIKKRMKKD